MISYLICRASVTTDGRFSPIYESETIVNIPVVRGFSFFDSSNSNIQRLNTWLGGLLTLSSCYFLL